MPKKMSEAVAQAEAVPEAVGPARYRARVYHEIEVGDGVKRVEPGFVVTVEGDEINAYPPEVFAAAFPEAGDVPDQPEE
jgi:hypothetical protein